jgi:hypothetical protein
MTDAIQDRTPGGRVPAIRTRSIVATISVALITCASAPANAATSQQPDGAAAVAALEAATEAALQDAAHSTKIVKPKLRIVSAEPVTWSDGSLGCPQEDTMYSQALVPGFRIVIKAGERQLDYHASADGGLVLCPPERAMPPVAKY